MKQSCFGLYISPNRPDSNIQIGDSIAMDSSSMKKRLVQDSNCRVLCYNFFFWELNQELIILKFLSKNWVCYDQKWQKKEAKASPSMK